MSPSATRIPLRLRIRGVAARFASAQRAAVRRFLWIAVTLVAISACNADMPELLRVDQMLPTAVEQNDLLLFDGEGFVPNAKARVRFSGQVSRRGAASEAVEFVAEGTGVGTDQVEVPITQALADTFLGASGHATFRGVIEIAFRPARQGAPPVSGRLPAAVLDVFLAVDAAERETDSESGVGLLEFLGMDLQRTGAGLLVTSVTRGSRAERAGFQVSDRIVVFGGLNVRQVADLLPYSGQRTAALGFRRSGNADVSLALVDVAGYAPRSAGGWLWGLALAGATGLLLLALRGPLGGVLAALEAGQHAATLLTPFTTFRRGAAPAQSLPRGLPAFLALSFLFVLLVTRAHLPAAEVDIVWLGISAIALLTSAALTEGGIGRDGKWSVTRGCIAAVQQLPVQMLLVLIVFSVGIDRGSLSLVEVAKEQGAAPWAFYAFTSPVGFLSAICLVLSVLLTRPATLRLRTAGLRTSLVAVLGRALLELHWLLVAALLVAMFLGGWQAPQFLKHAAPSLAGLLIFQIKYSLVYALGAFLRERLPALPAVMTQRVVWRWLLPMGSAIPLLVPVWAAGVWPEWLKTSWGALTLIFTLLLIGFVWTRNRWVRTRTPLQVSLNPWL